jgi:ATP-binding cassette subfamily F protein 3
LYKNISFQINPKDKIGIVGKNGAGKSTMLKLITGEQKPNSGTINTTNSLSIGYLPQEINVSSDEKILNEVLNANKQLLTINHRLDEINLELTTRTDYESDAYMQLLSELSDLNEQLLLLDGDNQLKDAELI